MKLTTVGLATMLAFIGLVLVLTALGPAQPVPSPDARVAPPAKNVPSEMASLAGVWEGTRGQVFPSRLVVEKVHPEWANILYAWEDDPNGRFQAGWVRTRAKILPGGSAALAASGQFHIPTVRRLHRPRGQEGPSRPDYHDPAASQRTARRLGQHGPPAPARLAGMTHHTRSGP